jgi:hypothetical protein
MHCSAWASWSSRAANSTAALAALQRCAEFPATARAAAGLIATIEQRLGHAAQAAEAAKRVATLPRDIPMEDPFVSETAALQTGLQAWLTQADRLLKAGRVARHWH